MALSTYLTANDIDHIVKASGHEIRSFLKAALHQEENHYSPLIPPLKDKIEHILTQLHSFAIDPDSFSDEALVAKGANIEIAYQFPIRIEVRRIPGFENESPQIAARGVMEDCRNITLDIFAQNPYFAEKKIHFKMSGGMSFEFNREGVEKSLPFKYLQQHWTEFLAAMNYPTHKKINALQQKTLIAADGDGTLFGKPRTDHLPTLEESAAYQEILKYLEFGGILLLISGNEFGRTIKRFAPYIPNEFHQQVIVAANGGANMAIFNNGEMKEYHPYSEQALDATDNTRDSSFHFFYFGDDSKSRGNDFQAFEFVGFDHGISVDSVADGIAPELASQWVGKNEVGVQEILAKINKFLETSGQLPASKDLMTFIKDS